MKLDPAKRVLYLTKDPDLIRRQLSGGLTLRMKDLRVEDLLDDVNTDAMTPAWACFFHRPEDIARHAYAGLTVGSERLFPENALRDGGFQVIVSGRRKGVGSSRETATQAEKWSGIELAVAESFAPIHARNNINQGVLMCDHALLLRLEAGEDVPLPEFTRGTDAITTLIIEEGGLFPFTRALETGRIAIPPHTTGPRPMTMAEKIIAAHLRPGAGSAFVKPGDAAVVDVDGGYSHEFTTAQVGLFLEEEYGPDFTIRDPRKFAVFEDHLIYADGVPRMAAHAAEIATLRRLQRDFQQKTGVRDWSADDGISPGICHQIALESIIEPGDFIQATDSHTCMGGAANALAFGVGATEYAALIRSGFTFIRVPESMRFELRGRLPGNVTAKDLILHILATFARDQKTLDRVLEFGGEGLCRLSMDERATLTNMATECAARTGICEADDHAFRWIAERRPGLAPSDAARRAVRPDPGAVYAGGVHEIDLSALSPMVATPGDPDHGIPSDPTNGAPISEIGRVPIDIAYGGSCTAGKDDDIRFYARVLREALAAGRRVAGGVRFYIQFGSAAVAEAARSRGDTDVFAKAGVHLIPPGCGACIGCGPGVSDEPNQVTVSAINRNYRGRSGPGRLYLASPLTVAASAVAGRIVEYVPGMFASQA